MLFPGLGLQKPRSEESKPIKSPLFPGLNDTKPSDQPIIDENKNKPLFPGNLEIKKNKSSLFGSDTENKGLFNIREEISASKNSKNDDEGFTYCVVHNNEFCFIITEPLFKFKNL